MPSGMHLLRAKWKSFFPDGLLRSEGGLGSSTRWPSSASASPHHQDQAVASYPGWPSDVRIPLREKLTKSKGKEGSVSDSNSTLKMSGSQVMHFTLHR